MGKGRLANSNHQGGVYQQIIEKVIQTSQNDFEESGVDHSTLDEMKQVCCNLASISASAPSFSLSQHICDCRHTAFISLTFLVNSFLASVSLAAAIAR